jgi:hypothetical protein
MCPSSQLPRAVALDADPPPSVPAALIGWAFLVGCSVAAVEGWLALTTAEASFRPFGLEAFALGTIAKAAIYRYGTGNAAGVLLAFAAWLRHSRGPAFASPRTRRWLALRVAGMLPVLAVASTACLIGSAALASTGSSSVCEFLSSADLAPALLALVLHTLVTGSVVFAAWPLLGKQGGRAFLVGKIVSLWLLDGVLWFAVTEVLWS